MGVAGTISADAAGRAAERTALIRHLDDAAGGRGHAVLCRGVPGIGKSYLLRAVTGQARSSDITTLSVTCRERESDSVFGAVRGLLGDLELDSGSARARRLLDGSARLALPALSAEPGPGVDAYAVLHGLHWLIVNLAAEGPLLLTVDDVQWCDESSLRWLEYLLRRVADLPVLVVLAHRTDPAGPAGRMLGEIAAVPGNAVVELGPLAEEEAAELVRGAFRADSGIEPEAEFSRRCAEVSGGNPLRLVRLLAELRHAGISPDHTGLAEVNAHGAILAGSMLGRLSADTLNVARAIAVLADEPELIGLLAGVHERVVDAAVAELRTHELLRPDRLDFAHDLVRAAVLQDLSEEELAALRAQAAGLLSDAGRPAEVVAGQLLLLPGTPEPWMHVVLRDAAAVVERRGAPGAAARYLQRVVEATPDDAAALVLLARSLAHTEPRLAIDYLERALTLVPDARARVPIAVQLGMTSLAAHSAPRAVRILGETLDAIEAEFRSRPGAEIDSLRMLIESALVIAGIDEKSTIRTTCARVQAMTPPPGDGPVERQLLAMHASVAALRGDPARFAIGHATRALRVDDQLLGGWAMLGSTLALFLADELDPALTAIGTLISRAQERGEAWTYFLALSTRSLIGHFRGDLVEAIADAQGAFDLAQQEQWGANATMPQIALATVLLHRNELDRAGALLDSISRPRFEEFSLEYHWYLMARARVYWAGGDTERALHTFRTCGESLDQAGIGNPVFAAWWLDSACVLAAQDRLGEAMAVAEHGTELARRWGTPRALGMATLARGLATGGAAGIELLGEAVDVLAGSPARLELARAEYELGLAHLRLDDQRAARPHLRGAIDLTVRSGDRMLLGFARQALLDAGGRLHTRLESPLDALSGSEIRVAKLAAQGRSNREIAESLFVTVRTVEVHLTSVYRKLGVRRRAQLASVLAGQEAAAEDGQRRMNGDAG